MKAIKPIIFCSLILGALSATQTDAFARFDHHGHGGFWTEGGRPEDDGSKYHAVLRHPEERTSGTANNGFHKSGPEIVTPNGVIQGYVPEGAVGIAHPESNVQKNKDQPKAEVSCTQDPGVSHCVK